jgi:mono/diheme cytochrome c family protein
MKRRRCCHAVISWIVVASVYPSTAAFAQSSQSGVGGGTTFQLYCASCHGPSAKGDGPLASLMTKRPADLTQIAKRNAGTFSSEQVARIIDGRRPVKGHGGGDMPVWGDAFAKSGDVAQVDERIRRLVIYLESIQVKP